jgi:hypothetical protein
MATLNIPARTLALGATTIESALGNINVNTIKAVFDFAGWVTGTLDYENLPVVQQWNELGIAAKASGMTPPPWRVFGGTTTNMLCNIDFGNVNGVPVVVHPTNVRVTTTVLWKPDTSR